MSLLVVTGLLALTPLGDAGATRLAPSDPEAVRTRRRVTIVTDIDQPRLVSGLWLALEAALPLMERATGHELPPDESLVVHLHGTIEAYREATRAVGVSGFMEVGAVTAWSTQESHLAVQPRAEPEYLAAAGWLPDLLLQLALHEAVHQFMARAGMYPAMGLPPWYAEGLADHLAERVLRELLSGSGRRWLMLDDAHLAVAEAVDQRRTIPLAELFSLNPPQLDQRDDRALFYDQSRALVAFLEGDERGRWGRVWRDWLESVDAAERPDQPFRLGAQRERLTEQWLEQVGNAGRLERAWWRELPRTRAPWKEVLGSTQWVGDDLLTAAVAWQEHGYVLATEPAPRRPRLFACEVDLLDLDGGEAYVVLHAPDGQREEGLKLTLRSEGFLSVVGWDSSSNDTRTFEAPGLRRREGLVALAVEIAGRELVIHVDMDPPIHTAVPGGYPVPGGGPWGLGTWRDAAVWRGVRFE